MILLLLLMLEQWRKPKSVLQRLLKLSNCFKRTK
jgi:hypothetical protein